MVMKGARPQEELGRGWYGKRAGYFSYFHYICKVSDCDYQLNLLEVHGSLSRTKTHQASKRAAGKC